MSMKPYHGDLGNYKPTPTDVEWTKANINRLKLGGVWIVPCAASIWELHARPTRDAMGDIVTQGKLVLNVGDPSDVTNNRIAVIAKAAGYNCYRLTETDDETFFIPR
jgi:hypothetical protein